MKQASLRPRLAELPVDPEPVRVTAKDNSFVVVLTSDVLFDFNKADLAWMLAASNRPNWTAGSIFAWRIRPEPAAFGHT